MIFTHRFGALAARPVFPRVTETDQERTSDRLRAGSEPDRAVDAS